MPEISVYGYHQILPNLSPSKQRQSPERPPSISSTGPANIFKDPSRCHLLELPLEIREQIYRWLLPKTTYIGAKGFAWHRGTTSILATCKQIHRETSKILYGTNAFVIDVVYDCSSFAYQWILLNGLIPKRTMPFPDDFAPHNIALLRDLYIRVHHVDNYLGMVKYNYGGHGLTEGLKDQVKFLCQTLRSLSCIRHLHIHLQDDTSNRALSNQSALEPFLHLKNTRRITTSGSLTASFSQKLQSRLTNAYARNCFLGLPPEIRNNIYAHILSSTSFCDQEITWHRGNSAILCTSKLINHEASLILYNTTDFFPAFCKLPVSTTPLASIWRLHTWRTTYSTHNKPLWSSTRRLKIEFVTENQVDIALLDQGQNFRLQILQSLVREGNGSLKEAPLGEKMENISERLRRLIQLCPALESLELNFYGCVPFGDLFGQHVVGIGKMAGRKLRSVEVHPFAMEAAGVIKRSLQEERSPVKKPDRFWWSAYDF